MTAHSSLHLHADDTYTPVAHDASHAPLFIAAVRPHDRSWTIQTTETDSFRALAAALIEAADKAEALYAETFGVPA